MSIPILATLKRWECPSCLLRHETTEPRPHVPMHICKAQRLMTVPFVEVESYGVQVVWSRHVVVEREDYVGGEQGLRFDGAHRPVMAVRTERRDGSNDCHVFPATATATGN